MKTRLILATALISSVLFTACNKDKKYEANNGQTQLTYRLEIANPSTGTQRSTAGTITWTSGFANPEKVKFEAKQDNSKLEYEAKHVGQIDLFAFNPVTFGNFVLGPGTYKELELKLYFKKRGDEPALQLNGVYNGQNMTVPVTLIVDASFEIKTEQKDVVIDNGFAYQAITTLDLGQYSNSISEDMWADADRTNGTIIISPTSNEQLYYRIIKNIKDWKHKCRFWHD